MARKKFVDRRMGWKKDKYDPRAKLFRASAVIPDKILMVEFLPSVRDQGNEGSCVGHGVGGMGTAMAKKLGLDGDWFGPRWIYNGARFLEGTIGEDVGCYPEDAMKWLKQKGWLLDEFWPYVSGVDTFRAPSKTLDPEAARYPTISYTRIVDGIDGICSALAAGKYVAIGQPWYDEWMDTDEAGNLQEVDKYTWPAGGHETLYYGYDRTLERFYAQNSWGEEWGKNGRFSMPFSGLENAKLWGGYDAHFIEVNWNGEPDPPAPEPPGPNGAAKGLAFLANELVKVICPNSRIVAIRREEK